MIGCRHVIQGKSEIKIVLRYHLDHIIGGIDTKRHLGPSDCVSPRTWIVQGSKQKVGRD
jgi:hypothetical protein